MVCRGWVLALVLALEVLAEGDWHLDIDYDQPPDIKDLLYDEMSRGVDVRLKYSGESEESNESMEDLDSLPDTNLPQEPCTSNTTRLDWLRRIGWLSGCLILTVSCTLCLMVKKSPNAPTASPLLLLVVERTQGEVEGSELPKRPCDDLPTYREVVEAELPPPTYSQVVGSTGVLNN